MLEPSAPSMPISSRLAGLRAGIGYQAETEGHAVKVGGLPRVAYVKLNMIGPVQLKQIFTRLLLVLGKRGHNSTVTPWVAQFYQGRKKDIPLGRFLDRPPKVGLTLCVRSRAPFSAIYQLAWMRGRVKTSENAS